MEFNEYQKKSYNTAIYPRRGKNYIYPSLGLVGEAGEIANKVKKIERDDNGKITAEKRESIRKELGDVLWYMAQMAFEFDLSLNEIARLNLRRLNSRKERGVLNGDGDER